ncbi:nuclease-related domain-containing protein [Sporosarcina sp. FSL K6-6792]|uniref:nuclease-related domain-containing protein n=1 Tax=Sporosarcina sp. FSL K6-6792 TaxID=2921559 RepID=UPI0030FB9D0F
MRKFISKRRKEPLLLEGLNAAIERIAPEQGTILPLLKARYASVKAGFGGEQQLDRIFESYSFPMKHQVLYDLSLTSSTHFQMDTLFITPSYAIIFEVKNIAGKLKVINNPPQLIRTLDNGEVKGFNSPITQVQSNCELLRDWFQARDVYLPIYGAIVLAYSTQRIELFDTEIPFLFPKAVPTYIRSLSTDTPLLDDASFKRLGHELVASHREFIPPPISFTYPDIQNKIITGVACPSCGLFGMEKYMKGWHCTACDGTSPDAHKKAIRDWFLLFGGAMKNKDCREFLHIDRQQTANRILNSMDLQTEGANRNRSYSMNLRLKCEKRT